MLSIICTRELTLLSYIFCTNENHHQEKKESFALNQMNRKRRTWIVASLITNERFTKKLFIFHSGTNLSHSLSAMDGICYSSVCSDYQFELLPLVGVIQSSSGRHAGFLSTSGLVLCRWYTGTEADESI